MSPASGCAELVSSGLGSSWATSRRAGQTAKRPFELQPFRLFRVTLEVEELSPPLVVTAAPTAAPMVAPTVAPTGCDVDKLGDIGLGFALGLVFAGGLFVVWRTCHKNSKPDTPKEGVELASVQAKEANV